MTLMQQLLKEHINVKHICLIKYNFIKQSQYNFNLLLTSYWYRCPMKTKTEVPGRFTSEMLPHIYDLPVAD